MFSLGPFYSAISYVILAIHGGLAHVFGADSGASWALSIVLLTVIIRLLLFPLFVKQIRAQRRMQLLQPKIAELRKKHKSDKETLNREMMSLYREHNANPLAGCLPLIIQLPIFYALFRVLEHLRPDSHGVFHAGYGFTQAQAASAASAKIFGAPIAASFTQPFGGSGTAIKIMTVIFIVLMGASTFITQRQMLARASAAGGDDTQMRVQKIMLYILPFSFVFVGFRFPLGVLLYWVTTNIWSMGQQHFVIRKMPPIAAGGAAGAGAGGGGKGPVSPKPAPADGAAGNGRSTGTVARPAGGPVKGPSPATGKPGQAAVAAVGVRRPTPPRAKRKNRRGRR